MTKVTFHGKQRIKERIGIPKRSASKAFDKILKSAKKRDCFTGNFRKYLDQLAQRTGTYGDPAEPLVMGEYIFIVGNDELVTTYKMPKKFRKKTGPRVRDEEETIEAAEEGTVFAVPCDLEDR